MKLQIISFAMLFLFAVGNAAKSQTTSTDYALKAQISMSAFTCSILASVFDDRTESERLFKIGYYEGKLFLKALRENKISQEDLYSKVPSGFSWSGQGPNDDFIIGRVYETTVSSALENFYKEVAISTDEKTKNFMAKTKYREQNCVLIKKSEMEK